MREYQMIIRMFAPHIYKINVQYEFILENSSGVEYFEENSNPHNRNILPPKLNLSSGLVLAVKVLYSLFKHILLLKTPLINNTQHSQFCSV